MADYQQVKRAKEMARDIRIVVLETLSAFGSGHIGGSMSAADLMGVLYSGTMRVDPQNPQWSDRDYFVCSKGHVGPVVYSALALSGFFPREELKTLNHLGTHFPSHCDRTKTPGIDMTAGSLGQGLSAAVGIALGNKLAGRENYCYALIGDGESQEGQIWKALMFAGHNKLNHLIAFIDNNQMQLDGPVVEINRIDNYKERLESFYWNAIDVDGHDANQILDAITQAKQSTERPTCIILHTVKGKGSFSEGKFNHNLPVSHEDAERNIQQLKALKW